jgi:hypothetical protein
MPRNALSQCVLQRHLQVIFSRTTNNLDVGTSAVHDEPRKRSFSQSDRQSEQDVDTFKGRLLGVEDSLIAAVLPSSSLPQLHRGNDREVDSFKGRLLGVEDGLIDAIGSESCPDHLNKQRALESSTTFPCYLQAEVRALKRRSLRSRKGPNNVRKLPAQQDSEASTGSLVSPKRVSDSSHPHPGPSSHRRDSIGSDLDEARGTYTTCPRRSIEIEHAAIGYTTLTMPPANMSSPSTIESDLPEVIDTPTRLDDVVVDSMMLQRSDNDPMLGTWDLSSWRTLEHTLGDLF